MTPQTRVTGCQGSLGRGGSFGTAVEVVLRDLQEVLWGKFARQSSRGQHQSRRWMKTLPYNLFFLMTSDSSFCLSIREWLLKVAFNASSPSRGCMALLPLVCEEVKGTLSRVTGKEKLAASHIVKPFSYLIMK